MTLFDFNTNSDITNWNITDDVVMGGRSNGTFSIGKDGLGVFEGNVSLENNGGFSMVQYKFDTIKTAQFTKIQIKLKGDGKPYQFRIKTKLGDKHSYIAPFETTGDWQTIEIPFNTMYPAFRGRKLDAENFPGEQMEGIGFLIGNKKEEAFRLEIDFIVLE